MNSFVIREIEARDNDQVRGLIREVLTEMGVPKVGTAYEDAALDNMYEAYSGERTNYFVVEQDDHIIGGAGVAPLSGERPDVCELQKMYFLPSARGRGIGTAMMDTCLSYAATKNFKWCYLETMPYMVHAQKLYRRTGFKPLDGPMGNTGHYNCSVWMLKELSLR